MKKTNKKDKKNEWRFNLKAWLVASIFSIISAGLGLTNLIIHFTDK